jgi:hypothetical protein
LGHIACWWHIGKYKKIHVTPGQMPNSKFIVPNHFILMVYTLITAFTLLVIASQYQVPCP